MPNRTHHAHDATSASDTRRRPADSIPRFQRLRTLIRREPKKPKRVRTGSSDWVADEVGSFCTPDPEEYTWNRQDQSERDTTYGAVIGNPTTAPGCGSGLRLAMQSWSGSPHHEGTCDEQEQWENPIAATGARFRSQAVLDSGYQSGSDEEGRMARRRRRLARAKRFILRLRDELRRRARTRRWIEMGLGGDEHGRLLWDGIGDNEGGEADDEGCEDSDVEDDDSDYQVSANPGEEGQDADDEESGGLDNAERGDSTAEKSGGSNYTFVTAPMVISPAERLLADAGRLKGSNSDSQDRTRRIVSFGLCPKVRRSADEERPLFGKLRARVRTWQRSVKDGVVG